MVHDGPLPRQHAGVAQLFQHAFDAVRVLVDVFDEQHALVHHRKVRCAEQAVQHAQIAAPQGSTKHTLYCARVAVARRHAPARALPLAGQQIVEAGFHDVVGAGFGAEVFAQRGT